MKRFITALAIVTLSACCTIMHGSKQQIAVNSTPSGARIFVDGQPGGQTPAVVEMARKHAHNVRIELDGYQPYEMALTRGTSGWVAGNLVFGGLIGLVVDASTGGMYKLNPTEVTAQMATTTATVNGRAVLHIGVVLHADPSWEKVGQLSVIE